MKSNLRLEVGVQFSSVSEHIGSGSRERGRARPYTLLSRSPWYIEKNQRGGIISQRMNSSIFSPFETHHFEDFQRSIQFKNVFLSIYYSVSETGTSASNWEHIDDFFLICN